MKDSALHSIILFIVYMLAAAGCDTTSNVVPPDTHFFMKLYGMDGNQYGVDLVSMSDGSFLLLGNTELNNTKRIYLVNVDPKGRMIWQKTLGGLAESAKDIEPTADGNFVILSVFENGIENLDTKLIRVRPDGTKIDSVVYGSPENDDGRTVTPLSDGGFIVTGGTLHDEADFNPENPLSNSFHFRCDANLVFDANWREFYGDRGNLDEATKTFEVNGSFYVFGYSNKEYPGKPAGNNRIHLQYYGIGSLGGADVPDSYLGEVNDDTRSASIIHPPDELGGGFLVLGTETASTGAVTMHVSRLREPVAFDRTVDELFDETISVEGRTLEAVAAAPVTVSSRGFLLLANEERSSGSRNMFLVKINQSAVVEWSVSLGSEEEDDVAGNALELEDGRIMVVGTMEIGDNQRKMALFKLNSEGHLQE